MVDQTLCEANKREEKIKAVARKVLGDDSPKNVELVKIIINGFENGDIKIEKKK